jgi:hypothetical protein
VPPEVRETIRRSLGLDQSWHIRYVKWLIALLQGDFGYSFGSHSPEPGARPLCNTVVQRVLLVIAIAISQAACTIAAPSAPTPTETIVSASPTSPTVFVPTAAATATMGGCGATTVFSGGVPDTLNRSAGNNAPSGVPYAVARPAIAAGFLFGYPLHTANAGISYSNKILWVVGTPRTGALVVDAVQAGANAPAVHYTFPANSGPGQIYPSELDVPEPGCWSFTLRFAGQVAELELVYR